MILGHFPVFPDRQVMDRQPGCKLRNFVTFRFAEDLRNYVSPRTPPKIGHGVMSWFDQGYLQSTNPG